MSEFLEREGSYVPASFEPDLSEEERERYQRNLMLPGVGEEGQRQLKAARVVVVGTGGLGGPLLYYLVAAGVGEITLLDRDRVSLSNLQRQILFTSSHLDQPKARVAAERLHQLNPGVKLHWKVVHLDAGNVQEHLEGAHLVLEASDNYSTKFLVNDAAVLSRVPLLLGAVSNYEGHVMGVLPGHSSCYRCLFREPPSSDQVPPPSTLGILGSAAGFVGSLLATEALRILLGREEPLYGSLLQVDLIRRSLRPLPIPRQRVCPVCGENPTIQSLRRENYRG